MIMVTRWVHALIAALFLVSASGVESTVKEGQSEHHEHPGVSDVVSSAEGHAHGDSDDHHESPEDDCHHHVMHCCCGHSQSSATANFSPFGFARESSLLAIPTLLSAFTPVAKDLLHVPIA